MNGGLGKLSRYLLAGAGAIGLLASGAPEAKAQSMQEIQSQIDQMQATIKALQKQVQDAKAQAATAQTTADTAKGSDLDLKIKWKGGPELSSADGKFKMKIRGRLETDYNHVDQDTAITSFPDVSATELRRARIGVEGILWYDWKYIVEVDFANDSVVMKDAYLQYQGFKIADTPVWLRAGNFNTFSSFEQENSDRFVDTMERAAFTNAWDIERQIGAGATYYAEHFGLAAGVFGQRFQSTVNAPLFAGFVGDEDLTLAARAFVLPIHREVNGVPEVLFFGASVRDRDRGDDQPYFQYGNRAGGADLHLANAPINTGRISEGDLYWGLQAAALWGPFSIQGEYARLNVDLPGGATILSNSLSAAPTAPNPFVGVPNPDYTGWYVEGSWFFGGHKNYNEEGRWGRPTVNNPMFHGSGGWGALQLVGKYDVLDMSDTGNNVLFGANLAGSNPSFVGACATTQLWPGTNTLPAGSGDNAAKIAECGEMKTWVVAVNWWMTDYSRLIFQYSESDLSGYATTPISDTTTPDGSKAGFDGAKIRGFGMRAQVDW
jgi:phosphate-selective porin OprO/OprP